MLKKTFAALLMLGGLLPLAALDFQILPLRGGNISDQWTHLEVSESPVLVGLSEAATGEIFDLRLIIKDFDVKDGSAGVDADVVMLQPGESVPRKVVSTAGAYSGTPPAGGFALSPLSVCASFDPADPVGKYKFTVTLTDRKTGTQVSKSVEIDHTGPYKALDRKFDEAALSLTMMNYYRIMQPGMIMPLWEAFLTNLPAQKKAQEDRFDPTPQLAFFSFLLADNPQTHEAFIADAVKRTGEAKSYALAVASAVPALAEKLASSGAIPRPGLFHVDKASHPMQLDILWCEFFVRGGFAPIAKIAAALAQDGRVLTIEEFGEISSPSPEDSQALLRGLSAMAAEWSLISNASRHPLVFYYLKSIVRSEGEKNPALTTKLKTILDSAAARIEAASPAGR